MSDSLDRLHADKFILSGRYTLTLFRDEPLVADGGQGLATANNGRFLAYREDSDEGQQIIKRRAELIHKWETDPRTAVVWKDCLALAADDELRAIDRLRDRVKDDKKLGLGRGELYKTVRPDQCVEADDLAKLSEVELDVIRQEGFQDASRCWVPFRKGDAEGNRWWSDDPIYIDWAVGTVSWLYEHSGRREPNMPVVRNPHLYFRPGVTWNPIGRDVALKGRLIPQCVISHKSLLLLASAEVIDSYFILALLNSPLVAYISKEFINSTNYEMNDLRQIPLIVADCTG